MLTPEYISGIADSMIDIYSSVEDDIIADIARRIVKTGTITDTAAWQIEKARQAGYLQGDVNKILARATGKSDKEIARLLQDAGLEALANDDKIYRLAGLTAKALEESPLLFELLLQGQDSTKKLLNNWTQTRALESEIAFRNLCDKAYMRTISGTSDSVTEIRRAVQELARKGITTVAYPSGAVHNTDYAVRRAVTTGINQTVSKLQLARAEDMGCQLVETTSHAGARPTHAVWQGQIFSLDRSKRDYPDFYDSTGYGTGEGLCGWNCYHSFYPFFEGLSTPSFSRDPSADAGRDNDDDYALSQKQRYYERQVREAKRECITYRAAMDSATDETTKRAIQEDYTSAAVKLKRREGQLSKFISDTGRTRLRDRESTGSWSVPDAAKARGAAQSAHHQWLKSINATDTSLNTIAKYYEAKYNNTYEYRLLTGYNKAVEKGDIFSEVGFARYKSTADEVKQKIVGITTSDGVQIKGFATHFIDRIIGQTDTPQSGLRQGVPADNALEALIHPSQIISETVKGDERRLYIGDKANVVISVTDEKLIQTNPKHRKKG